MDVELITGDTLISINVTVTITILIYVTLVIHSYRQSILASTKSREADKVFDDNFGIIFYISQWNHMLWVLI